MKKTYRIPYWPLLWLLCFGISAQKAYVRGLVLDSVGNPLADVNILSERQSVFSDSKGAFLIGLEAGNRTIQYRGLNVIPQTERYLLQLGETLDVVIQLRLQTLKIVEFSGKRDSLAEVGITFLRPDLVRVMPVPGDGLTQLIRAAGIGVAVNSELGSGYNVRGGNFDENLTYVNGVEVYRPFLARAGQQEGLSFVNPDMVQTLGFSAGGFEARFGDKMASVLDVQYKKPLFFEANGSISFLGGQFYVGDALFKSRLKTSTGFRYKSNNYILSGLDTRGDYRPVFMDFQSYWVWDISEKFEISVLGNYSDNRFDLVPQNRSTTFGHVQQARQLNIFFEGKEVTRFEVGTALLAATFKPGGIHSASTHKITGSAYQTLETENFDVIGQYFLGEVESDMSSDNFGEVKNTIGYGTFHNHARNRLWARVLGADYQGKFHPMSKDENVFTFSAQWGFNFKQEQIDDRLNEWNMLDSSGYHLPFVGPADTGLIYLDNVLKTKINLRSHRYQAFYQNTLSWDLEHSRIFLTGGIRAHYWDLNGQWLFSPRIQAALRPKWEKDILFRMAGGRYYQAPFYRELRDFSGGLNTGVQAQESWHAVLGMDYEFKWWKRPFKWVTELYYKGYSDLNPYKIDNVRIRYYARNNAVGYATGLDMKLNGEFIPGLESWLTFSLMHTAEDILDDSYTLPDGTVIEPGFIPRPTDQTFMTGIFFQDNIPKWERCRVHLNLLFGSKLPFGPPGEERFSDTLRAPFYRRVDIGFSLMIIETPSRRKVPEKYKWLRSMWTSFEVFNLLDVNNTISYLWIRDISSRKYAVPNYLTPRLFNLKFVIEL